MNTYIFRCQHLYKIGRTKDVGSRFNNLKCGNPFIEKLKVIKGNYEKLLHDKFKDKRRIGEWFELSEDDLSIIDNIVEIQRQIKTQVDSLEAPIINKVATITLPAKPKLRLWCDETGNWQREWIKYND